MTEDPQPTFTMLSSALWYASVGLRVFPLAPGTKVPRKGSNGCLGATRDADLIRDWWERDPDDNIGIATGYLVDVVDIDGAVGQKSRVDNWCDDLACRAAGSQPNPPDWWTPTCDHPGTFNKVEALAIARVSTPRPGGQHIYVPAQGDGNSAGIFPGVDYRGKSGYVVGPPSTITDGPNPGAYRFLGTPNFDFKEQT